MKLSVALLDNDDKCMFRYFDTCQTCLHLFCQDSALDDSFELGEEGSVSSCDSSGLSSLNSRTSSLVELNQCQIQKEDPNILDKFKSDEVDNRSASSMVQSIDPESPKSSYQSIKEPHASEASIVDLDPVQNDVSDIKIYNIAKSLPSDEICSQQFVPLEEEMCDGKLMVQEDICHHQFVPICGQILKQQKSQLEEQKLLHRSCSADKESNVAKGSIAHPTQIDQIILDDSEIIAINQQILDVKYDNRNEIQFYTQSILRSLREIRQICSEISHSHSRRCLSEIYPPHTPPGRTADNVQKLNKSYTDERSNEEAIVKDPSTEEASEVYVNILRNKVQNEFWATIEIININQNLIKYIHVETYIACERKMSIKTICSQTFTLSTNYYIGSLPYKDISLNTNQASFIGCKIELLDSFLNVKRTIKKESKVWSEKDGDLCDSVTIKSCECPEPGYREYKFRNSHYFPLKIE